MSTPPEIALEVSLDGSRVKLVVQGAAEVSPMGSEAMSSRELHAGLAGGTMRVLAVIGAEGGVQEARSELVDLSSAVSAPLLVVDIGGHAPDVGSDDWKSWIEAELGQMDQLRVQTGARVALRCARPGSALSDVAAIRALLPLLTRHREGIAVTIDDVLASGMRANELWRCFASRIDLIGLGSGPGSVARREVLVRWGRLAATYNYPGIWSAEPVGGEVAGAAGALQSLSYAVGEGLGFARS